MAISTSLQAAPAKQSRSNWQQLSRQITLQAMAIVLPVTLLASAANAQVYELYSRRLNSRGERVAEIQRALSREGFFVQDDNIFGSNTEAATKAFQRSRNLSSDGEVGDRTLQALGLSRTLNAGYESFLGPVYSGECQPGRVDRFNAGADFDKRYRVIVPTTQIQMLQKVRYYCPNARAVITPLGSYISVGSFVNRGSAEAHSRSFHQRGIRDAHVRYF